MNIKIALGIFLPLVLIILLVVLSSVNVGFSIDKETVQSIQFDSLFTVQIGAKSNIPIQTITLNNNFFMPKRYELTKIIVCLNDKEGLKNRENLNVKYSEGTYSRSSDVPIFDEVFFDYSYYGRQSIELPGSSKKQVKILVEPKQLYRYEETINSYRDFDEILLIESKDNKLYRYNSCSNLETKELDSAIHIQIMK